MARRRSFMATRMSKMRGLERSEKDVLVKIGQIVDTAINNRTPTNPTGVIQKFAKSDPRLPSVRNLQVNAGVRSVKITWDPVDGTILDCYSITITNMGTGETFDRTSYTSTFTFKGESGGYKAEIRAIGRNKVASPVQIILFTIPDSVMILEGAKNGVSTESPFVSEVVLTPADYKVFAWASFVLNSFASPIFNNSPIVQLLYGDTLSAATLIQSITMFPESETATNLNDLDYDGILRPVGPTRAGNFETTHSVMFAPFDVPDAIANQSTRFWVNVTNRDSEADVISASIVLWVGSGGRGELGVTPVAAVNPRSIDLNGTSEILTGYYNKLDLTVEDEFTVAFWVKPFVVSGLAIQTSDDQGYFQFSRDDFNAGTRTNQIRIYLSTVEEGPQTVRTDFTFTVGTSGGVDIIYEVRTAEYFPDDIPDLDPPFNNQNTDIFTNGPNVWNFVVGTWKRSLTGGARLQLYMNGSAVTTDYPSPTATKNIEVINGADTAPDLARSMAAYGGTQYQIITSFLNSTTRTPQARYNSMGLWNKALTAAEVLTLYNDGAGANIDWRTNQGNYVSASNMAHYWLLGLDTTDDQTICKDYGNSLYPINLNIDPPNPTGSITVADDVVTDAPV